MRRLRALLLRLGGVFGKRRRDGELAAEMESHLAMHIEDNLRAGMSATEARRQALIKLGGVEQTKELYRERRGLPWVETLWNDLRFGARVLRKNPSFTLAAVLTLALGIGANTAIFSVVNGVLLSPLPFAKADQLVVLYESTGNFGNGSITYPNFLDWQNDNHSFKSVAAFRPTNFTLTGAGEPERILAAQVSSEFFSTLGVKPIYGRFFAVDDDRLGAAPVALVSEAFWHRKFGSSPSILGQSITLNGTAHVIVGIIPASFHLELFNFRTSDVYTPIGQWTLPLFRDRATAQGMDAIGRLQPGVSLEQARADMDRVTRQLATIYPREDKGVGARIIPLKQDVVGDVQPVLLLLFGAVALVLLIACVNVANLLLARSTGRTREFGIRAALGATTSRLVRQLLTESVLLAIAGGVLGLILASFGVQGILKLALNFRPEGIPRGENIGFDLRVLGFTAGTTLLVGFLFGLVPALKTRGLDTQATLKEGARGTTASRSRTQSALVISQLAMALALLVGAGLMIRTLVRFSGVNPGFDSERILTFYLSLDPSMYTAKPDAIRAVFRQASDSIASVPRVDSVAFLGGSLPMQGDSEDPFWVVGRPKPATDNEKPWALWYEVDPSYLKAMGIPLLRGRFFSAEDTINSPHVAVIDETFAAKYFAKENPIGRSIVDDYVGPTEIIGVIGHVKHWGLDDRLALHAQMYFPFAQVPDKFVSILARGVAVVVRTQGPPSAVIGSIRAAVTHSNGGQVIFGVRTMKQVISSSLADRRFLMTVLAVFATAALLLAGMGIYGVLSYLVSQRTFEIGIRLALGAQRHDVLRLVLNDGVRMAVFGVGIGLMGALLLSQLLTGVLFGVRADDPFTFAIVSVLLSLVALAACYIPARRAMRVDPIVALRYE